MTTMIVSTMKTAKRGMVIRGEAVNSLQDMAGAVGLRDVRYVPGENHFGVRKGGEANPAFIPKDDSNPYFTYDPAKCIVCSRCVRACEEVQGTFALTIEGRGFDSRVKAGGPLDDFLSSDCVSCGACVQACPTATLQEKSVIELGTPTRSVITTCAYCGVGCSFKAELNGDEGVIAEARTRLAGAGAEVHAAINYVESVSARLRDCLPGVPLHFDLAELRAYHYQTGVVFAAFVPGMGQEIARGGRYDHIGKVFGRARPATGFSADLKDLLSVGQVTLTAASSKVFAPAVTDAALTARIEALRAAGRVVIRELPGQVGDAAAMGCAERLVQAADGNWELASI